MGLFNVITKTIRVAYLMRIDAFDKPGGDVVLMRTYIQFCSKLATKRGLVFEGVILTELDPDLTAFHAVHLTNLDRPIDLYAQYTAAKRAQKRIIITPLHHSFREIERYERHGRGGIIGIFSGMIGFNCLEVVRIALKSTKYPTLRPALVRALKRGIQKAQAEVLTGCDSILVAADKEAEDIRREIVYLPEDRFLKVRNGFQMPSISPAKSVDSQVEICVVSRIEARKNQIAILEALESLGIGAVFVGPENPNHKSYCEAFKRNIRGSRSTYIPGVPPEEVAPFLAKAHVHVAASWFEVSSLVDIDAYILGCRVVASQCGGTRELLGDNAYYVDPASTENIAQQIAAAVRSVAAGVKNDVEALVQKQESWEHIADRLLHLYTNNLQTEMDKVAIFKQPDC